MMTDDAGSTALSAVIGKTVQKEGYKKVRKTLELPNFLRRAIREVRRFKNREMEYVYSGWMKPKCKRKGTT
jgi:hypothetical protein